MIREVLYKLKAIVDAVAAKDSVEINGAGLVELRNVTLVYNGIQWDVVETARDYDGEIYKNVIYSSPHPNNAILVAALAFIRAWVASSLDPDEDFPMDQWVTELQDHDNWFDETKTLFAEFAPGFAFEGRGLNVAVSNSDGQPVVQSKFAAADPSWEIVGPTDQSLNAIELMAYIRSLSPLSLPHGKETAAHLIALAHAPMIRAVLQNPIEPESRIGTDAALRAHVPKNSMCRMCKFVGDDCKGVVTEVEKWYGRAFDTTYPIYGFS